MTNFQLFESVNKAYKKRKKDRRNQGQECACNQKSQEDFTLAIEVNAFELGKPNLIKKKNKDQNYLDRTSYDLGQVKYYNC